MALPMALLLQLVKPSAESSGLLVRALKLKYPRDCQVGVCSKWGLPCCRPLMPPWDLDSGLAEPHQGLFTAGLGQDGKAHFRDEHAEV